ncbi:hypothetical protein QJQ45_011252 [Haematococcus lacustris]|nr:hypothetical protein QJQ45_011252 [Haematococcus lacustris]
MGTADVNASSTSGGSGSSTSSVSTSSTVSSSSNSNHGRLLLLATSGRLLGAVGSKGEEQQQQLAAKPRINAVAACRLTLQVQGCGDWEELQQLFLTQRPQLNTLNLLALMRQFTLVRRVKRMHKYEDMESAVFLDQVVQELIAPAHIGGLTARAVANLLWSLARLGHHPGQLWLDRVLDISCQHLQQGGASPLDLSQTFWALAKLKHHPPPAWLDAFFPAIQASLPDLPPQNLANVIWAAASLQVLPQQPEFMTTFLRSSLASLPAHSPQALSNTAWALMRLGVLPPQDWQQAFWQPTGLADVLHRQLWQRPGLLSPPQGGNA